MHSVASTATAEAAASAASSSSGSTEAPTSHAARSATATEASSRATSRFLGLESLLALFHDLATDSFTRHKELNVTRLLRATEHFVADLEAIAFDTLDRLDGDAGSSDRSEDVVNLSNKLLVLSVDATHEKWHFLDKTAANESFDRISVSGNGHNKIRRTLLEATAAST